MFLNSSLFIMDLRSQKIQHAYNIIGQHFSHTRKYTWKDFVLFEPFLSQNMKVLDIGCGNGRLLHFLKPYRVDYTGTDFSDALLQEAQKDHPNEHFFLSDMTMLDKTEYFQKNYNTLDAIFSIAAFHHIPSKKMRIKTLRHFYDLLAKNGVLCMTLWNLRQPRYMWNFLESYLLLRPRWVRVPWKNPEGKVLAQRYYYHFFRSEIITLAKQIGFSVEWVAYTKQGVVVHDVHQAHNMVCIFKK